MKIAIMNFDNKEVGSINLPDDIFALKPRRDILQQMVNWQLAKRRVGSHKVKHRSEINRTKKKIYAQKGTGQARHGAASAPQFRGGGRAFGPLVRKHDFKLNKKFRSLALRHALSVKTQDKNLMVLENFDVKDHKTASLQKKLNKLGVMNGLLIDGEHGEAMKKAASNIKNIDILPVVGVNVYDIMRREKLVMTKSATEQLLARFENKTDDKNMEKAS